MRGVREPQNPYQSDHITTNCDRYCKYHPNLDPEIVLEALELRNEADSDLAP